MTYEFNKKVTVGKFEIQVDELSRYGCFEHEDLGDECGGGLWFGFDHDENGDQTHDRRLHLEDYDGVFQLPKKVIEGLRGLGYVVSDSFE